MMREGLAVLINQEPDLSVAGEAGSAAEAFELIPKLKPHLALIDITLPGKNGLELVKDVTTTFPETLTLVLSMHDESLYAERVLRAGGRGYIMKQEGGKKIIAAIRQVLSGGIYVSEKMSARILEIFSTGKRDAQTSPVGALTDREFEVLQLIGRGAEIRDIAAQLHISVKTAEVHRANLKQKLGLKSVSELIRYAVRWVESH